MNCNKYNAHILGDLEDITNMIMYSYNKAGQL